ncbi:hypothetical protein STEG23_006654, partial [Scotinomys teguina]
TAFQSVSHRYRRTVVYAVPLTVLRLMDQKQHEENKTTGNAMDVTSQYFAQYLSVLSVDLPSLALCPVNFVSLVFLEVGYIF